MDSERNSASSRFTPRRSEERDSTGLSPWSFNLLVLLMILGFQFLCPGECFCANKPRFSAKSAIVINAKDGKILFEKNSRLKLPAASTTKVLTALVVMEQMDFEKPVLISRRASEIAPSKIYLSKGCRYQAGDLVKALLISSANDAGVALAEAVSGEENLFAQAMNQRAQSFGAKDSLFLNATGLPESRKRQYSTVYDLSLIMKKAAVKPELVEIMRTKSASICGSDGKVLRFKNHNKFLWKTKYGFIGKTGYTRKARHCFLGVFSKDNRDLIVAVLGSSKLWDDLAYLMNRSY